MKSRMLSVINNEKGDFGIKQIAITVAVIVIIGFAITAVQGLLPGWIGEIWTLFIDQIEDLMS